MSKKNYRSSKTIKNKRKNKKTKCNKRNKKHSDGKISAPILRKGGKGKGASKWNKVRQQTKQGQNKDYVARQQMRHNQRDQIKAEGSRQQQLPGSDSVKENANQVCKNKCSETFNKCEENCDSACLIM